MDGVTVRIARKSDIAQLVDFMNMQYAVKKNNDYFIWQFFDSYYPSIIMCAFEDSRLIGMFGMQKRVLDNGISAGQAMDSLVAPDWRKKGITTLIGKEAINYFNDLDMVCAFPNQHWKKVCEKVFGWKTICKINAMVLDINMLKGQDEKFNETAGGITDYSKFKSDSGTRVWRFDNHPYFKYTNIKLDSGAYAVTKVFVEPETGAKFGDIVDLECDLYDRELLRELLLKVIIYLRGQNIKNIMTWALPGTPLRDVVESLGFTEMPQERYFCINVLKKEHEYLYDPHRWHFVQADAEFY